MGVNGIDKPTYNWGPGAHCMWSIQFFCRSPDSWVLGKLLGYKTLGQRMESYIQDEDYTI